MVLLIDQCVLRRELVARISLRECQASRRKVKRIGERLGVCRDQDGFQFGAQIERRAADRLQAVRQGDARASFGQLLNAL